MSTLITHAVLVVTFAQTYALPVTLKWEWENSPPMKTTTLLQMRFWISLMGVLTLLWLPATYGGDATNKDSRVPKPEMYHTTKAKKCVEPEDIMKRQHMQFILHQRDETMYKGVRTKQHSLKNCINCHADPKTNSVLGKDGFCESCHAYAAVSMDCFSCHTDKAEKKDAATAYRQFGILDNAIENK